MAKKTIEIDDLQDFFDKAEKAAGVKSKEPLQLTEEEEISRMSACGFTVREMALQLGYVYGEFKMQAETIDSDIWRAIQAGKLMSDFTVIDKQRQLAESGNITAVQIFNNVKEEKRIEQIKNKIWFGT